MSSDSDRIVQVTPAAGWFVHYKAADDQSAETVRPLVAWGLTAGGDVIPLDSDHYGWVEDPRGCANFGGIYHSQTVHHFPPAEVPLPWKESEESGSERS